MIALVLLLAAQPWAATHTLDLSATSSFVSFGDHTEFNAASRAGCMLNVRRSGTGWFSATRVLEQRHATGKAQFIVRVAPYGSATGLIQVGFAPTPTAPYVFRWLADTPAARSVLTGRAHINVLWTFDRGNVSLYLNGASWPLSGTDPLPTALTTVSGADFRVGSTDLLQAQVANVGCWVGEVPDDIHARALWCRAETCDLSEGFARGPRGEAVAIPAPVWWSPLSDDLLPRVGSVVAALSSGTPSFSGPVSVSPAKPGDAVAFERFEIRSGSEAGETRPHAGMPALLATGGELWISHSKGAEHLTFDQDVFFLRSASIGRTWPWKGVTWPGERDGEEVATDTDQSARGSTFCELPGGRILHMINLRMTTPQADPSLERYVMVRHTDDRKTWSPWREAFRFGTRFTSIGGGHGCVELEDGSIGIGVYKRDYFPGSTEIRPNYTTLTAITRDHGITWTRGATITDEPALGAQWEEPAIGWLESGCPISPDGKCYAGIERLDYPGAGRMFVVYSTDFVHWTAPVYIWPGRFTAVWRQLADGTILSVTKDPSSRHAVLRWSRDGMQTWSSPVDLALVTDGPNVGSSLAVLPDGRVAVASSHEHLNTTGRARLEFMILRPLWEE